MMDTVRDYLRRLEDSQGRDVAVALGREWGVVSDDEGGRLQLDEVALGEPLAEWLATQGLPPPADLGEDALTGAVSDDQRARQAILSRLEQPLRPPPEEPPPPGPQVTPATPADVAAYLEGQQLTPEQTRAAEQQAGTLLPAVLAQAAGIPVGMAEEAGKFGAQAPPTHPLGAEFTPMGQVQPAVPPTETQTQVLYGFTESDFKHILEQSIGTGAVVGLSTNLSKDLADNMVGILSLLSQLTGYDLTEAERRADLVDLAGGRFGRGRQLGGALVGGTLGGTAAFLRHPIDAASARPFSTLMMVLPALQAARAGLAPGLVRLRSAGTRLLDQVEKLQRKAGYEPPVRGVSMEGLPFGDYGPLVEYVRTVTAEPRAKVERFLKEPTAQLHPEETAAVEQIAYEGARRAARVESGVKELAGATRRGPIRAEDLLVRDPAAVVAPEVAERVAAIVGDAEAAPVDKLLRLGEELERADPETRVYELSLAEAEHAAGAFVELYNGRELAAARADVSARHLAARQAQARTSDKWRAYDLGRDLEELSAELGKYATVKRIRRDLSLRHRTQQVPRLGEPPLTEQYVFRLAVPDDGGPLDFAYDLARRMDAIEANPAAAEAAITAALPPEVLRLMRAREVPLPPGETGAFRPLSGQLAKGRVVAALGEPKLGGVGKLPTLEHPIWGPIATDIIDTVRSSREVRRTMLVQEPWRATPLRGRAALHDFAPLPLQEHELAGFLASVFRDDSAQLLRSGRGRGAIIDHILEEPVAGDARFAGRPEALAAAHDRWQLLTDSKTGLGRKRLDTLLQDMGETNLLDKPFTYEVVLGDPKGKGARLAAVEEQAHEAGVAALLDEGVFDGAVSARPEGMILEDLAEMAPADAAPFRDLYTAAYNQAYDVAVEQVERARPAINLADEATEAFGRLAARDPKLLREVRAEALESVGKVLADSTAQATSVELLNRELSRFRSRDLGEYATEVAKAVLVDFEHKPLLLSQHKPSDLHRWLDTHTAEVAGKLKVTEDQVRKLAREINFGYTRPDDVLNQMALPVNRAAIGELPEHVPVTMSQFPPSVTAVTKGLNETLAWQLKAQKAIELTTTPLDRWMRAYKAHLTTLNLSSHKNNFLANLGYRCLQKGIDPASMMLRLGKAGDVYLRYLQGRLDDPELLAAVRSIDRTGLLDTTLLEGEIGGMGKAGLLGDELQRDSRLGRGLQGLQDVVRSTKTKAGQAYRLGDNLFKLDIALENLGKLKTKVGQLEPGEWLEVLLDDQRIARLTARTDGGPPDIRVRVRGGRLSTAQQLESGMLDDVLARAAGKPAQDVFFDYSKVPIALQMLRASGAGGVVSPYLTWAWKALDIPGVKKGLLGNILSGDGGVWVQTNSAAINGMQALEAGTTAMRRSYVVNGLRNAVDQVGDRELRELFKRLGKDAGVVLIDQLTDPGYLDFMRLENTNWAAPTEALFRSGIGAYLALTSGGIREAFAGSPTPELEHQADELAEDDPRREVLLAQVNRRKLWLKHQTGETWNVDDVLSLVGLSGNPIIEFLGQAKRADESGGEAAWRRCFQTGAALLIGATPAAVVDVTMGGFASQSPLLAATSTRKWALDPNSARQTEPELRWAIRRLTGLGWRTSEGGQAKERYIARVERTLRGAIETSMRDQMYILQADYAAAPRESARGRRLERELATVRRNLSEVDRIIVDELQSIRNRYGNLVSRLHSRRSR